MSPSFIETEIGHESQEGAIISGDYLDSPETYTIPIEEQNFQPLAIVGFSLRFPQDATTAEAFWKMLMEGRSAMTEYPKDRMNIDAFYHPDTTRQDTISARGGHFVTGELGAFDAPFFSITPAEASDMDPMQRGLLESAYRAFENAGLPLETIVKSKTSVYTGCFTNDYQAFIPKDPQALPKYSATGCSPSMLANRLSWFFDLTGNSVNLDSACSSSLTALHLACQDLWSGESTMAVAAGCNLIFSVEAVTTLSNMNFLSTDSRCYSFDHRANGYARGEGFGVVIIKTLASALKNGDTIRAVIRSTGTNQDGYTPGITQPRGEAQELLIKETYRKAGLSMKPTMFFEAHGTGTAVGDPVEANSIGAAFGRGHSCDESLYVGAVKSNIGHLEGASGLAGLLKTILVLEKGVIPPNTNFESLNPKIDAERLNLKFSTHSHPWPHDGLRRASVNSFGFGGTNCHVILDDAYNYLRIHRLTGNHSTTKIVPPRHSLSMSSLGPPIPLDDASLEPKKLTTPKLLIWSAADRHGTARLVKAYNDYFQNLRLRHGDVEPFLDSLGYTLAERRTSLPWRSFIVINSTTTLLDLEKQTSKSKRASSGRNLGFIFTGQGAQWPEMGRELFVFPVFRNSIEEAEIIFHSLGSRWSLRDELKKPKELSRINEPEFSQSICTAIQVALVDLLESFAIRPSVVVGHSSGEIAAAYCTGAISRHSALKLAYFRGMLTTPLAAERHGAMIAVGLSPDRIEPFFDRLTAKFGQLCVAIACYNSPENLTISGDKHQIDLLKGMLEIEEIFVRKLQVDVAYHSSHMKRIASHYFDLIKELEVGDHANLQNPIMVSSVTGIILDTKELLDGRYWVNNLVSPVNFLGALSLACSNSQGKKSDDSHCNSLIIDDLLEIGPHSALQAPVKEILKSINRFEHLSYDSILIRHQPATDTLLSVVGRLHCTGYSVNVSSVNLPCATGPKHPTVLTDLPEYPFDHSKTYWSENRLSKAFRFRKHPRLDLLGTPVPESNSFEKRWRHTLKISELPWMEDHQINGSALYPGSGMIVMAIEAMKQSTMSPKDFVGFNLKEVFFQTALVIPLDREGVDIEFSLLSSPRTSEKSIGWSEFRLYSHANDDCVLICHGSIQPQYQHVDSEVDGGRELLEHTKACNLLYEIQNETCTQAIETEDMYRHLEHSGMQYGPAFRRLEELSCNDKGDAIGKLTLFRWMADRDTNHLQPHVIHPASLDGLFQMMFIAMSQGGAKEMPTMIPTRIHKLWVSSDQLSYPSVDSIAVCAKSPSSYKQNGAFVVGLDAHSKKPVIVADGVEAKIVANAKTRESQTRNVKFSYAIDWKPDLTILSNQQQVEYCESGFEQGPEPVGFFKDLQFTVMAYITQALKLVDKQKLQLSGPHYQKYFAWMEIQAERFNAGTLMGFMPEWPSLLRNFEYQDALRTRLAQTNVQGKTYVEVGRNLIDVLQGTVDPLVILFQTGLVSEYYEEVSNAARFVQPMTKYLQTLVHKHPSMKILEIGAGTGGMTRHMLNSLMPPIRSNEFGTPLYSTYEFTDISRSFFAEARAAFAHHGSRLKFGVLDINEDPESQDFEVGVYDMVVAASVLHVTKDLNMTIGRVRRLLKPGGKLVLLEPTNVDKLGCGFIFGLLPGWWPNGNDGRNLSPLISQGDWNTICTQNGFSEAEILLSDYKNEYCQESTIMVFTALEDPKDLIRSNFTPLIIAKKHSLVQQKLSTALETYFQQNGYPGCTRMCLQQAKECENLSSSFCISLLEVDDPALRDINESDYRCLQKLIASGAKWLWVSRLGRSEEPPSQGIMDGLSRVLRTEDPMLILVTLELHATQVDTCVNYINSVFKATLLNIANHAFEPEYKEISGLLHCKRIVEERSLDYHVSSQISSKQTKTLELMRGPPLTVNVTSPGLLDSIQLVEDDQALLPLAQDQIEIEVKMVGLNFMDLLTALGRLGDNSVLGTECAGIVSRVGCEAETNFKIGDRVLVAYTGLFRTYARCPYQCAVLIPESISFADAAAMPTTFGTAYHSLHNVARLQKGETILIHSAAGATGQSAIQIARHIGAEIFATVGSDAKKKFLMDFYGIPEDHIFFSRNTLFAEGVRRMTNANGVDVVLNSLSGEGLVASWECIAPHGRFIEIGKKDIQAGERLPMLPFARNVTFSAVDMASMTKDRPLYMQELLKIIMEMTKQGEITPSKPVQVYQLSEIEQAFRHMQSGQSIGKSVIEFDKQARIQATLNTKPTFLFDPNSTYIIAGGLGGIGRAISRWFVGRGARNLILLSRGGLQNGHSASIKEELKCAHVETPACDITDIASLKNCLENCLKNMPPIKGCIQAAVDMRDSMFTHMPYIDWKATLSAKVQGSWNLHSSLPCEMDFFVFLSSASGIIGRETQANYSAGNTYMDSLAQYRISLGRKAVSLDLGILDEDGILSENHELMARVKSSGALIGISTTELYAILDYYCNPSLDILTSKQCQPIIGIETPANLAMKKLEPSPFMNLPTFRHFFQISNNEDSSASNGSSNQSTDFAALFSTAGSVAEAGAMVVKPLIERLSTSTSVPIEDISEDNPMQQYGVDSLVAIEIRNWFSKKLGADIAVFDIMGKSTIRDTAVLAAGRSMYKQANWTED